MSNAVKKGATIILLFLKWFFFIRDLSDTFRNIVALKTPHILRKTFAKKFFFWEAGLQLYQIVLCDERFPVSLLKFFNAVSL